MKMRPPLNMYGRMLAEGRGVPPHTAESRAGFARAADSGHAGAQVALAVMVNGRGAGVGAPR
jgi:TPR repeat protein